MKLALFLLGNMVKQAFKGNWHEAYDAWCWFCFHVWYLVNGKAKPISKDTADAVLGSMMEPKERGKDEY